MRKRDGAGEAAVTWNTSERAAVRHLAGADGVSLALDDIGAGERTVVIVHGGGQSRSLWRPVARELSSNSLRVVSFDLRGHGESGRAPAHQYRLQDHIADLELLLDGIIGPVSLLGHSFGGKIALCVAASRGPARVESLVLVEATPDMKPDLRAHEFYRETNAGFASLDEAASRVGAYLGRVMSPERMAQVLVKDAAGRHTWPWDMAVLRGMDTASLDRDVLRRAAQELRVPTLLLRTEESHFVDGELESSFRTLTPHLRVEHLAGARHHRPWDPDGQLVPLVVDLVEQGRCAGELIGDADLAGLFSPYRLKGLELQSRFVMAPMTRNHSPDGRVGDDVVKYYGRRAANVGLIITEGIYVPHASAGTYPDVPQLSSDEHVAAWHRVVETVHRRGGRILAQLWHVGAVRRPGGPPVATAPVVSPSGLGLHGQTVGTPLSADGVGEIIDAFAAAAANAKRAGFDGVEIHAAHGYLIDQFHWAQTNHRRDRLGGDLRARSTFGALVASAVREAIGPGAVISYRFSQWKSTDYGARVVESPDELADMLAPIVAAGVDVLHASTRRYWEPAFEGSARTLAGWAKRVTGLPVIAVGSVGVRSQFRPRGDETDQSVSLAPMVQLVSEGEIDLMALGRSLLSDPEWTSKVRHGRPETIRWYRKAHEATLW